MGKFKLPNEDDFIPTSERPICPICGNGLIHTEIRVTKKRRWHVWMCDCEPQAYNFAMNLIKEARPEEGGALVIERRKK